MKYLPYILKNVVSAVSTKMMARSNDPFDVVFHYGLYQHVFKKVYEDKDRGIDTYPLVWLVMPFDEEEGRNRGIQADASIDLIIAMPTEPKYTMEEREAFNFFPRIFPIYEELLNQLYKSRDLIVPSVDQMGRRKRILPYWGGDETGNNNTPNLSKHFVDAIQIKDLKLQIRQSNC